MKFFFLFLLLFNPVLTQCQVIDVFEYMGQPYHHRPPVIHYDIPNAQFDFIFCTINVPDSLIIEFCSDTLIFFIGAGEVEHPDQLYGFVEMTYQDDTLIILQDSANYPVGFENHGTSCWKTGGTMLLHLTLPKFCCNLKWTIIGNKYEHTVYSFKVIKKENGYWEPSDTLVDYSCSEPSSGQFIIDMNHCIAYWQEIINAEVDDEPEIRNPDCDSTGFIHFPNFPQFNRDNLLEGVYEVTINNSYCEKTFTITLHDRKVCKVYVPNIFSPNGDGINDNFDVSNDKGSDYRIWIYDRWGELLHEGVYNNNFGWDGYFRGKRIPPGVYVYRIQILNEIDDGFIVGDVTITQ